MKKFTKILISATAALTAFGGFAQVASAAGPLEVVWGSAPLFNVSNFVPGQTVNGDFTIKNNDSVSREAYIEAVLAEDEDNLSSQMHLKIFDGNTEIRSMSFEDFLEGGYFKLSDISAGASENYRLEVAFLDKSDNDAYQGKNLSFDVCVGLWGGETRCTKDQVIGPSDNTGSGGGGGSGSMHLVIYNDRNDLPQMSGDMQTAEVTVRWETNKLATSQVIYGPASGAPYNLDLDAANFGYPLSTSESLSKTMNHAVVLSGLEPGDYVYRVVSRASPATVSYEHTFTVPTSGNLVTTAGAVTESGAPEISTEEGSSIGPEDSSTQIGEVAGAFDENDKDSNLAAVSGFGGLLSNWWIWVILIAILAYIIWRLHRDKRGKQTN